MVSFINKISSAYWELDVIKFLVYLENHLELIGYLMDSHRTIIFSIKIQFMKI